MARNSKYSDSRSVPVRKVSGGKSPNSSMLLPSGHNTPMTGGKITTLDALTQDFATYGLKWSQGWFGPGVPFPPVAPPEVAGRTFDYPYGINLQFKPRAYEALSFTDLRNLADNYDLMRLVIETRKDQVEAVEWEIVPKHPDADPTLYKEQIDNVTEFFLRPDKELMWSGWLRKLLEDLFVIDTVSIYPRFDRKGALWSLDLVDGGTVKRVLDETGRTPMPPDPAFQQVLKGLPAVDYQVWNNEQQKGNLPELLYFMRNPRSNRIYGMSPVEQVVMTVNIALRRQISQLQYYTEGNIPEALVGVPETWSMDQIAQFQTWFDAMMLGDQARLRRMKFVPGDPSKIKFTRENDHQLKDLFDEWLARIICFAFSISPTSLVKETNRATSESVAAQARAEGFMPLLMWLNGLFDLIVQNVLGFKELQFSWKLDEAVDPKTRAEIDQIYLTSGVITPDWVRKKRFGLDPLTEEEKAALKGPGGGMTQPLLGPDGKPLIGPDGLPIMAPAPGGAPPGAPGAPPFGKKPGEEGELGPDGKPKPPVPGAPGAPAAALKPGEHEVAPGQLSEEGEEEGTEVVEGAEGEQQQLAPGVKPEDVATPEQIAEAQARMQQGAVPAKEGEGQEVADALAKPGAAKPAAKPGGLPNKEGEQIAEGAGKDVKQPEQGAGPAAGLDAKGKTQPGAPAKKPAAVQGEGGPAAGAKAKPGSVKPGAGGKGPAPAPDESGTEEGKKPEAAGGKAPAFGKKPAAEGEGEAQAEGAENASAPSSAHDLESLIDDVLPETGLTPEKLKQMKVEDPDTYESILEQLKQRVPKPGDIDDEGKPIGAAVGDLDEEEAVPVRNQTKEEEVQDVTDAEPGPDTKEQQEGTDEVEEGEAEEGTEEPAPDAEEEAAEEKVVEEEDEDEDPKKKGKPKFLTEKALDSRLTKFLEAQSLQQQAFLDRMMGFMQGMLTKSATAQPIVNVHTPDIRAGDVHVNLPEQPINVNLPEQPAQVIKVEAPITVQPADVRGGDVHLTLPEQPAPVVNIDNSGDTHVHGHFVPAERRTQTVIAKPDGQGNIVAKVEEKTVRTVVSKRNEDGSLESKIITGPAEDDDLEKGE